VNHDTTQENITDWITNKAVKGDKLIFNSSSYNLNSTIVITKPIHVVSYKNTVITMNSTSSMFDLNTTSVRFTGLNLINYGKTNNSDIEFSTDPIASGIRGYSWNKYIKCDIMNTNITADVAINIYRMSGSISNSKLISQSTLWNPSSLMVSYWKGNFINSEIKSSGYGISNFKLSTHHTEELRWMGNIRNSNITSRYRAVDCVYWKGIMSGNRIYSFGDDARSGPALALGFSQGTITKNIIRSNATNAIHVRSAVKVTNNRLIAKKGFSPVHRYLPDLYGSEGSSGRKGRYVYFSIHNIGYEHAKSSYLGVRYGNAFKRAYIPPIRSGKSTLVRVLIPQKTERIVAKIDHYNKIREETKKNNYIRLRNV